MPAVTKTRSILVLAAVLASAGAAAQPTGVMPVRFDDLNLETPAGVAQLERRLERASRSLCATDPVLASPALDNARRECEAETLVAARSQLDAAVRAQRASRLAATTVSR